MPMLPSSIVSVTAAVAGRRARLSSVGALERIGAIGIGFGLMRQPRRH